MLEKYSHLHRLSVIAEEGSMRRAAARLHLTQPALSRSIGILEDSFGRPLLERHARGVRLTPFGERILVTVQRLNRQWDIAQSELRADAADDRVTLRLGLGPIWRTGIMSPIFEAMRNRHPNLLIEISPLRDGGVQTDLNKGKLDIALGGARLDAREYPNIRSHYLLDLTIQITAREGHPVLESLKPGDPASESQLLDYPWISYTEMAVYADEGDFSISQRLGREPRVWMKSANLLTVLTTLETTDSLCVLSDMMLGTPLKSRLVPVPINLRRRQIPLGLFHREELSDWVMVSDFLLLCQKEFLGEAAQA